MRPHMRQRLEDTSQETYAKAHLQMNYEAKKQKWYYDRTMSTMQLVPGYVVLMKSDAYQGK